MRTNLKANEENYIERFYISLLQEFYNSLEEEDMTSNRGTLAQEYETLNNVNNSATAWLNSHLKPTTMYALLLNDPKHINTVLNPQSKKLASWREFILALAAEYKTEIKERFG
jgi:hypothetical protein